MIGHLADKPLIKDTADGRKIARFSILIEDSYFNAKGSHIKDVQQHTLVAQGRIAALAEKYLSKGMTIAIVGRLVNRQFDDSRGSRKYITEVMVTELLILNMQMQEQQEYSLEAER